MTPATGCPDDAVLRRLLAAEAEGLESGALEEHLGGCPDCRRRLEILAEGKPGWRFARGSGPASPVGPRLREIMGALCAEAPDRQGTPEASKNETETLPQIPGYEVFEELGRGGMGVVYRARQASLHREVALKVIRSRQLAGEAEVRRFRLEAEAAARLEHANIVPVYEVGEHSGCHYFSMRLVRGGSLADAIARRRPTELGGPKTGGAVLGNYRGAVSLVRKVARAVHHAHQRGVLHRDLKPSNLLLDEQGEPHITDFGLAKLGEDATSALTVSNAILGTPAYMAPEQAAGRMKEVTTASDVYALGGILYELLTGSPPFQSESVAATLQEVLHKDPIPVRQRTPEVPADLEVVCHKCLEKDPTHRYATAADLADDLDRVEAGEPIAARPRNGWQRAARWVRRQPGLAAALAALVTVFVVGLATSVWLWRGESRQRRAVEEQAERTRAANTSYELERAFRAGDSAEALGTLARLARAEPNNRVVAERLVQALTFREFCLPLTALKIQAGSSNGVPGSIGGTNVLITSVSVGADWVLTASSSGYWQVWDGRTGAARRGPWRVEGGLHRASFDPAAERVVTVSLSGEARVWRVEDGQALSEPWTHEGAPIVYAEFDAPGRRCVTVSGAEARVWELSPVASKPAQTLIVRGTGHQLYYAGFSPDGECLLTAGKGGPAQIWDLMTGRESVRLDHQYRPESTRPYPTFRPDSRGVVFSNSRGAWLRERGDDGVWKEARELRHDSDVIVSAFAPGGQWVATGAHDAKVRIWRVSDGAQEGEALGHRQSVTTVQFDPQGRRVLSGSRDRSVRLRYWADRTSNPEPLWHASPIHAAALNSTGDRIVTVTRGGEAWLWEVRRPVFPGRDLVLPENLEFVKASPTSDIVAGLHRGRFVLLDPRRESPVLRMGPRLRSARVTSLAFSGDGEAVALGLEGGGAWVGRVESGAAEGPPYGWRPEFPEESQRQAGVRRIQFAPQNDRFATAAEDGKVRVWRRVIGNNAFSGPRAGTPLLWERALEGRANDIAFSPDGTQVVVAGWDRRAWVFNADTGEPAVGPLEHEGEVHWARFDPAGQKIVTASRDKTVRVWAAIDGRRLFQWRHAEVPADDHSFDISPDGTRVATIAGDRFFIWSMRDGNLLTGPVWVGSLVTSIRFSPDGRRVVTASDASGVCVWDAEVGQPLGEPWGEGRRVAYAEFRRNGRSIVAGGWDGTLRIRPVMEIPLPLSPTWPDLAEALAGYRTTGGLGDGRPESVALGPQDLLGLRNRVLERAEQGFESRWLRWFFLGDRWSE